jgi:hypothetical protein
VKPSDGWFFIDSPDQSGKPGGQRPAQCVIRLEQFQSAARSAITELGDATLEEARLLREVEICPWGKMLRGYEAYQVDE